MSVRIITGPPGIGDLIWVIMKLINANEKFIWRMPDGRPQRGHQLFELLPSITHSWYYDRVRFSNVRAWNVSRKTNGTDTPRWKDIHNKDIFLEANTLLENGERIENFLPDLPISFRIDYQTTDEHKKRADDLLGKSDKKTVGIYMSSIGTNTASGTWVRAEWISFLGLLEKEFDCRFVFFAAGWDFDLLSEVVLNDNTFSERIDKIFRNYVREAVAKINNQAVISFKESDGDVINDFRKKMINAPANIFYDEPLGTVIEAFKKLDYLIGFQSGMNIINETLGKDGMMLYRKADRNIMGTWADPRRIAAGNIKECQFAPPDKIVEWIKENNKL